MLTRQAYGRRAAPDLAPAACAARAGESGGGDRGDRPVPVHGDALVGEELTDVVREGVQGARLPVDVQRHRLVVGDERAGAARQERDDERLRHQAAQVLGAAGHPAPPPRPPRTGPATTGSGHGAGRDGEGGGHGGLRGARTGVARRCGRPGARRGRPTAVGGRGGLGRSTAVGACGGHAGSVGSSCGGTGRGTGRGTGEGPGTTTVAGPRAAASAARPLPRTAR
ncbi:hypothetical protein [Streptomyces sp. ADI92-24]|uniref:hypothetical protein n=1 Tax=Streptomyces sp. ADI92-24 TaxID=1522756 RepID=UPI002405B95D|nr:hypothetical protein [Streptomyces sp. ADI92-24]